MSEADPVSIGFLITEGFPVVTLSAAIEPLRAANEITGENRFCWHLISENGSPVASSSNIRITPDAGIEALPDFDILFVIGGTRLANEAHERLQQVLRRCHRMGVRLGGISGGVFLLARAGLFDHRRCAVHWYYANAFREQFADVEISNRLFEIEEDVVSCAGGIAAMEMMLKLMTGELSNSVAHEISAWFHLSHIRDNLDEQGAAATGPVAITSPKLAAAVSVLRRNVERPLPISDVAVEIGISPRQLERLFKSHFGKTPSAYYREIRLRQARELLNHTVMPLSEIAVATGFQSFSHFSRCYLQLFGERPRRERAPSEPA